MKQNKLLASIVRSIIRNSGRPQHLSKFYSTNNVQQTCKIRLNTIWTNAVVGHQTPAISL